MGEPVCLVRWLKEGDSEVERIAALANASVNLRVVDARCKRDVFCGLTAWAADNDAAQCIYFAAHGRQDASGNYVGLTSGEDDGDWIAWLELANFLVGAMQSAPVLWLGACGSAAGPRAWSNALNSGHLPAAWIVAFEDVVFPAILQATVERALKNMSLVGIVFLESELPSLRESAGPAVKMFYPAHARDMKRHEYVSADDFPARVGCPFPDFIRNGGHC